MSLVLLIVGIAQSSAQIVLHEATDITQTKATLSADFPDLSAEHGFEYKYGTLPEIDEFSQLALSLVSDPVQINNKGSYPWSGRNVKGWIESNPNVPVGQNSTISVDVTIYNQTDISFEWSIDSEEEAGILTFYVDNTEIKSITGLVDFQTVTTSLGVGSHTLKWSYIKRETSNLGLDLGMIRNITISNSTYGEWITEFVEANQFQLNQLYPHTISVS